MLRQVWLKKNHSSIQIFIFGHSLELNYLIAFFTYCATLGTHIQCYKISTRNGGPVSLTKMLTDKRKQSGLNTS